MGARVHISCILLMGSDRAIKTYLFLLRAMISFLAVSCSHRPDHAVVVRETDNAFYLSLHVPQLASSCYAPKNLRLNGNLGLPETVGVNSWAIVRGERVPEEYLDLLLSGERQKVGNTVKVTVPRFIIMNRPFYFIINVFPCDAPTRAKGWKGNTVDIVGSADLPLPFPPGYREPGAGDANDMTGMMLNTAK